MKKIALFHTSAATLGMMQTLIAEHMPQAEVMHIIEDSMIKQVMKHGGVSPEISARIAGYINNAEKAGCEIFMTACSSIGGAVEQCQFMTTLQLTRIDSAMVDEAIALGGRISVLATVATTLEPTLEFVRRKAAAAGKNLDIVPMLMPEAFIALLDGDNTTHDRIVAEGLQKALASSDVVMLAQASMARVLTTLPTPPSIPGLTSPERGILWLKQLAAAV